MRVKPGIIDTRGVCVYGINEYSSTKHIGVMRCISYEWDDTEFFFK